MPSPALPAGGWTGLPDIPAPAPAQSQAAQSWLLSPTALPSLETIPFPWAPLQGLTTLTGIFFPPLDPVVIPSAPGRACCLNSNEMSLILFSEETKHNSPPFHVLYAPGPF